VKLCRHQESPKVANMGIYEESKHEPKKKPSAILENNLFDLQFYVSLGADKISKLLLVCVLFIISVLSLLNIGEFSIRSNDEMISLINLSLSLYKKLILFSVVVVIFLTYMYFIIRQSIDNIVISLENDCNLFEKAVLLSSGLYYDNKSYLSKQSPRSRYANYCVNFERSIHKPRYKARRDREPSRIPTKQLTRVLNKSRNIRKFVRHYISKNVPASSRIHCFIAKCCFNHSIHCKYKGITKKRCTKATLQKKIRNIVNDAKFQSSNIPVYKNFVFKYLSHTYKSLKEVSHSITKLKIIEPCTIIKSCFVVVCSNFILFISNYCLYDICQTYSASLRQLMLSGDIELNPGPFTQGNMIQSSPYTILKSRLSVNYANACTKYLNLKQITP
jgi:hypothetical protein